MSKPKTVQVDGVEYVRADSLAPIEGDRFIVVLDRGWIFVGNLSWDEESEEWLLADCSNIRKWSKGGFGALSFSAKAADAVLDKCADVRFSPPEVKFKVQVSEDWG